MSKLKYLVIHCTATREGVRVTGDDIRRWHLSPKPRGRGWKQVGYTDLIHLDGTIEQLADNDYDDMIQPWEITNGAAGYNSQCIHICYVGGLDHLGRAKDTRTPAQRAALEYLCSMIKANNSEVKIVGHNYLNRGKACPCFDVEKWLKTTDI